MSLILADNDEQRTADWRQARAGSITGSGFGIAMSYLKNGAESKARKDYRFQLVTERITGVPKDEISAAALSWGKDNEEPARIAYEMLTKNFVTLTGFKTHPELDWVGVSPDGLVDDDGMIEIKCPYNSGNHLTTIINASKKLAAALLGEPLPNTIAVPEEHWPQIQGNLWVLDRQWCDFVSYDPRVPAHLQLYVARVERDEAFIKKLEAEVRKLLDEVEASVGLLLNPEAA